MDTIEQVIDDMIATFSISDRHERIAKSQELKIRALAFKKTKPAKKDDK